MRESDSPAMSRCYQGDRQVEPQGDVGQISGLRPACVCERENKHTTCLSAYVRAHGCRTWSKCLFVCLCVYTRGALRCSPS